MIKDKIAFTLCSNNYLAQAKTLADSVAENNPGYFVVIGLIDKVHPEIDYDFFKPYDIIEVDRLRLPQFNEMVGKYRIVELNTAVKPFYFEFLFKKYPKVRNIKFFDPDIKLFGSLKDFDDETNSYPITLTPHITTPIPISGRHPQDNHFLKYGVYNLGFLSLNRDESVDHFLSWWRERLEKFCFIDRLNGYFVDQLWMNLAPIFFRDKVYISYDLGLNMAHWNFHERRLVEKENAYWVNDQFKLIFYHFSGYEAEQLTYISKGSTITFEERPDVKHIFQIYQSELLKNKYEDFKAIDYVFYKHSRKKRKFFKDYKLMKIKQEIMKKWLHRNVSL